MSDDAKLKTGVSRRDLLGGTATVAAVAGLAGAGVAGGEDDVARNLALDVEVELLHLPLLELQVLRVHSAGEGRGIGRRCDRRQEDELIAAVDGRRRAAVIERAWTDTEEREVVGLGEVGRIFP